ncbi:hypothetical protein NFI96_015470 [Prochilodus magdalenae]|nr:hypothetical protein NFI96_015470 [Prochilodus magdalenae]
MKNPEVVAGCGGLSALLKNALDCQQSRINEALITTVLHLLNHPRTRQFVRADVELEQILAPYTDFHYRHNPDMTEAQLKTDREARFSASKMAIVAAFRSWSGIINLCRVGNSGIRSLIGLLCIPNMEMRKALLEVLYEIFRLPVPVLTADFEEALHSVDPSRLQDGWRLGDGFVAAEAKVLLPHRARSRPDLLENYLALVLSHSFRVGLVEVVTSSDEDLSVRATVLLGELLHMASSLLPHSHSHHLHCLPTLINMAASFDISPEKRLRASAAVTQLKRLHELKKRSPKPHSLYLQLILKQGSRRDSHRSHRDTYVIKDTEDALMMNLRDSQILNHKQNLEWNWVLISTVLKWPNSNLRNYRDEQMHKFVRRLLYFYKPSSKLYCVLDVEHPKATPLTLSGCQLISFLLDSEEDGRGYLEDLVKDIVQWLSSCSGMKSERSLQSNGLLSTLSQHYFLFLGTLSAQPAGVKTLEKCGAFQCLLNLCSLKNQDALLKLDVHTSVFRRAGSCEAAACTPLSTCGSCWAGLCLACGPSCRLYATKHLRVLLRANVEFFSNWGIELLVTQLPDHSKAVSMEALDILDEACEEKANLHALIHMKPALTHLGDKGLLLLLSLTPPHSLSPSLTPPLSLSPSLTPPHPTSLPFTQSHSTSLPFTQSHPTSLPFTQSHPISLPFTQSHPISLPFTQSHPTSLPFTQSHPISLPFTQSHPTSLPFTQSHPTSLPFTQSHPTSLPFTQSHPTSLPFTQSHSTSLPFTQSHPTSLPFTQSHPISLPFTQSHPISLPFTQSHPISLPFTQSHSTSLPFTQSHPTSLPFTQSHPTSLPFTQSHPTSLPFTQSHPTSLPFTQSHPTSLPFTQSHPISLPFTQSHPTSLPFTQSHPTSLPLTQSHSTSPHLSPFHPSHSTSLPFQSHSIPVHFTQSHSTYLNERGYVSQQLEKWHREYNLRYVDMVEELMNEALTTYRKPVDGDNYVRRSNQRSEVVPYCHLIHTETFHLPLLPSTSTSLCFTPLYSTSLRFTPPHCPHFTNSTVPHSTSLHLTPLLLHLTTTPPAPPPCTSLHLTPLYLTLHHSTSYHSTCSAVLHLTPLYSTSLRCTPPHSALLYLTSLYSTSLHCTPPHSAVLHLTLLYSTSLRCTPPHSAVLPHVTHCFHSISLCFISTSLLKSTSLCSHPPPPHSAVLHHTLLYSTTLCFTPPHSTSLCFTPPHFAVLHLTPLYSTSLRCTPPHSALLHLTLLYSALLHLTLLYSALLHLTLLYSTSLCFTPPHSALLRFTPPHSALLRFTPPHSALLHLTLLYSTSLCFTPPHSAVLHLTPLYSTSLRCTPPHSAVLHLTLLYSTSLCFTPPHSALLWTNGAPSCGHVVRCECLCVFQNVVPDLSYTVRSPVLDHWQGIKQLKAALWALGNVGSSNWGVNLLQEENIIPDIITLAQRCEVLSVRGVCVYVLGVISRTRQGSELLKALGWDSVRHGRRQQWPVVEETETRLPGELSSIPSTLSLNSESNSSQRESESESQPSLYFVDDESDGVERSEDVSVSVRSKPAKDRSPFTILPSTRQFRNRFLNSLPLPSMKPRSTSDPKHTAWGKKSPEDLQPGAVRRKRTLTEPSSYSPGGTPLAEVFFNGGRSPHSPATSLETSFIAAKNLQDGPGVGEGSDAEGRGDGVVVFQGGAAGDGVVVFQGGAAGDGVVVFQGGAAGDGVVVFQGGAAGDGVVVFQGGAAGDGVVVFQGGAAGDGVVVFQGGAAGDGVVVFQGGAAGDGVVVFQGGAAGDGVVVFQGGAAGDGVVVFQGGAAGDGVVVFQGGAAGDGVVVLLGGAAGDGVVVFQGGAAGDGVVVFQGGAAGDGVVVFQGGAAGAERQVMAVVVFQGGAAGDGVVVFRGGAAGDGVVVFLGGAAGDGVVVFLGGAAGDGVVVFQGGAAGDGVVVFQGGAAGDGVVVFQGGAAGDGVVVFQGGAAGDGVVVFQGGAAGDGVVVFQGGAAGDGVVVFQGGAAGDGVVVFQGGAAGDGVVVFQGGGCKVMVWLCFRGGAAGDGVVVFQGGAAGDGVVVFQGGAAGFQNGVKAQRKAVALDEGSELELRGQRERRVYDGLSSGLPGGAVALKSRSQSFNTDTTTSGISSMSSSPSRETTSAVTVDTDCGSISTVVSANTVKTDLVGITCSLNAVSTHCPLCYTPTLNTVSTHCPLCYTPTLNAVSTHCPLCYTPTLNAVSTHCPLCYTPTLNAVSTHCPLCYTPTLNAVSTHCPLCYTPTLNASASVSLVPPGSANTLPRRAASLRSSSTVKSLVDYGSFSPRDALGYATLRRLQQQRIHPSLSHSEVLASPAKDVLFADAITMKTRSLDLRLHAPRRFLKALSFVSLDKDDLLSPINQSTLQRSASLRSMVSSTTYGSNEDYIGLALPMDISVLFHIDESSYFQKRTSPSAGEKLMFFGDSDRLMDSCRAALKHRVSITELLSSSRTEQRHLLGGEESTGLKEHTDDNCLYCSTLATLGEHTRPPLNNTHIRTDLTDGFSHWQPKPSHTHLEVVAQSKFSGVSGCSDAAVSQGSTSSTPSSEILLGGKVISEDGPACRVLLRKEILRLVINLSSSVGTKGNETGLLTIKEKFPCAFDDACLYSEVSFLLASCRFRLLSRRFIQELFLDVQFVPLFDEAEGVLSKPVEAVREDSPTES